MLSLTYGAKANQHGWKYISAFVNPLNLLIGHLSYNAKIR